MTSAGMHLDRDGDKYVITDAAGRSLSTGSSAVAEGIARLVERFPSSSSVEDCAEAIPENARTEGRALLLDALYRMALVGMVTLSSEPVLAGIPGDTPVAIALARRDAADGSDATTNVRHETVSLDPATRALLPVMDGTLDRAALARRLEGGGAGRPAGLFAARRGSHHGAGDSRDRGGASAGSARGDGERGAVGGLIPV